MRRLDETPIDPEVEAALDAIDATLAGQAVDPRHADLAELALLLAAERPVMDEAFARSFDEKVQARFAPQRTAAAAPAGLRRHRLWFSPAAAGLGSAAVAAVVVAIVLVGGSSPAPVVRGGAPARVPPLAGAPAHAAASKTAATATSTHARALATTTPVLAPTTAPNGAASASGQTALASGQTASGVGASSGPPSVLLQPPPNGRKIVQGAQLELTTASSRVDAVAQEVFDVVGQYSGIVSNSTVTATGGPGAYAEFQLSVPSSSLPQTMAALSTLRYAQVASRTDTTQDVNDQYESDVRALADARALRTSLLKQLANATTQAQIDSLTAQIHDAEASISSDQATLAQLNQRINFSQITVTINTPTVIVVPSHSGGSGFTLRKAAHDAGRVLTVAAGVALIALAALVPVALLGALAWWGAAALRRRRREQTLDTV